MKKKGPRNIGLGSIRSYQFPITAISSILHRLSGLWVFIIVPFMIWSLDISLQNENGFEYIKHLLLNTPLIFIVWLFLAGISYHILAGLRHLIMDMGIGEELCVAKATSVLVIVLGVLFAILWGVWLLW